MMQQNATPRPLVTVVTPFYNTAPYLAECIESVLGQTYSNFEYILADNCSTDGSSDIAENYARRDSRIRFIRNSEFVSQLKNYNRALTQLSPASQYCKIVQADDFILPACLELMVNTFERSPTVGLVSSYRLLGERIDCAGYPYRAAATIVNGKDCGRWYLQNQTYIFGSQTTVMYRSAVIRNTNPFFDESVAYADFKICMDILKNWDFGFVHQVLSFSRPDIPSIRTVTGDRIRFQPFALDRYAIAMEYASLFFDAEKATAVKKESKSRYYRILAEEALHFREPSFWRYHIDGLKRLGETLDWPYLLAQTVLASIWLALNPGWTAIRVLRFCKRRLKRTAGFKSGLKEKLDVESGEDDPVQPSRL